MSKPVRAAAPPGNSILGVLKATEIIETKPVLPAEILATIINYLPIPDLMRFARTSRRMREMVYDDTRWVARLQSMGCWNEAEARKRFEEAVRRRREAVEKANTAAAGGGGGAPGQHQRHGQQPPGQQGTTSTTIFDAAVEEERRKQQLSGLRDGFETMSMTGTPQHLHPQHQPPKDPLKDPEALLSVLKNVRSARGYARLEYGKIYGALAPFYLDLARAKTHADPILFKVFRDPERQAQMLSNLRTFAHSDWAEGWHRREEKLATMTSIFESAVLREFEQGYEFWDVDGRMRRYAHVLDLLNGSTAGVDLFIQKHPLFSDRDVVANSMECINQAAEGDIALEPSRAFFERLAHKVNEQGEVIARIFPNAGAVFWLFVDKVREDIIMEYTTPLFDESHERSLASYLKAVSGVFEQCMQFFRALQPPKGPEEKWDLSFREQKARELGLKVFEPHLDLYLQEELDFFTRHAEAEVGSWEKKLSEQDASVESFYMANFTNRVEDKKDFLSSFKKVVMMPVTVLPNLPGQLLSAAPFGLSKSAATSAAATPPTGGAATANGGTSSAGAVSPQPSRPQTPSLGGAAGLERKGTPGPADRAPADKAPTDELAAKAALMASRLEGIKSLFSIEVALNLVHAAKASLGRAAVFIRLGGQAGEEAREQCETIFVVLLRILGNRHVKNGFVLALEHLSHYNPREVKDHSQAAGVAPLVTFIELVNVGDLISQMIDVFYEQQLAGPKIADRNDFLDPAGLAKKKFEQMLDESVAAGLNKGIDVLMDEVEYICATTQLPTDYYPEAAAVAAASSTSSLPNPFSSLTDSGDKERDGSSGNKNSSSNNRSSIMSFSSFGSSNNNNNYANMAVPDPGDIGPTKTAQLVVELVRGHTSMLVGSTEKTMLDVFNGEVGLRLFTALCKHLKRQRVSTSGAVKLIADMTLYFGYVRTLRNQDLLAYFRALRELSQIYLIDAAHAKEMATIIADADRFGGVFRAEEVYEFAERRADWYQVKRDVERAMYGLDCVVM